MNSKQCSKCGEFKPSTEEYFHKDSRTEDKLNRQCKECINKYQRERHKRAKKKKAELIEFIRRE